MLKYQEIIKELTIEQKLSLIADFTSQSDLEFSEHGFKCVSMADVESCEQAKAYPDSQSLINSWNSELVRKVSDDVALRVKKAGITLMGIPGTKIKATPYSDGLTEDVCLATDFWTQYAGVSERVGMATYTKDPYLTARDVRAADVEYNERAVKEYFLKPTEALVKHGGIISLNKIPNAGKYAKANEDLDVLIKERANVVIRENATADQTLANACNCAELNTNGSVTALKEALEKYKEYRSSFEAGNISLNDVETACRSGNALSPEMIDEAVDKILDFSKNCYASLNKSKALPNDKDLYVKAVEESIVLLKNDKKILPIGRKYRVALVGALMEESLDSIGYKEYVEKQGSKKRYIYAGYAKGYSSGLKKEESLIKSAVSLASKADVVVVAVGYDKLASEKAKKNGTTALPANQIALLQALYKTGRRIIAVVYGGVYPDMQFDRFCEAVLLAPMQGLGAAQGLDNVLCGSASPSGRLANTCYVNTDAKQKELRQYKNAGRNQVGMFFGYRRYETANVKVKYPFGYGLTYSKFKYLNQKVRGGTVSLTVKNVGKFPASEVVQLYVGKENSDVIRPKLELKAFKKVYLAPGKSIRVSFDLSVVDLKVFDVVTKTLVSESGFYNVYVGPSVSEAQNCGKFSINGVKLEPDGKKPSDYFQTVSNIKDKGYHLDVPMKIPKESAEKRRKFAYVASVVMICLDIMYLYLNYIGWLPKSLGIHVAMIAMTVLPLLASWVLTNRKNNFINKYMEVSKEMKMENREKLNQDELMDEVPYYELFEQAFAEEDVEFDNEEEQVETVKEDFVVKAEVFDKEFKMPTLCSEFITYLSEREMILDPISARALASGMGSARLIIVRSDEKDLINPFITLFGKYLGSQSVITPFETLHDGGDNMLTYRNEEDKVVMTEIATALTDKEASVENMRIIAITDMLCESIKPCFTHLFKYVDSPEKPMRFFIHTDEIEQHFDMPDNVWFMITLADGERLTDIPKYILDTACVVDLAIRKPKEQPLARTSRKKKKEEVIVEQAETTEVLEQATTEQVEETIETPVENTEETVEQTAEQTVTATEETQVDATTEQASEEVVAEESEQVEEEVDEDAGKTAVKKVLLNQFVKMVNNAGRDCQLDENLWKRVDKLEDYVATCREYRIENKLWQRMEKYVSTYLAAGGEPEEALDSMVAHHIIYGMLPAVVEGKGKKDDKFTHVIENIFGEGHAPQSIRAVKSTGLNV